MLEKRGGTQLQELFLNEFVDLSKYKKINLIINHAAFNKINNDKINILWCHHYIDQPSIQLLKNENLVNLLDAIVFVSDWQKNEFLNYFNLPKEKCHVIKNAINIKTIKKNKSKDKIKLIYTSTPWRGLNVLANSILYLNKIRNDFHLDVYSSTEIYGEKFHNENKKFFVNFFKELEKIPNINSYGYIQNKDVIMKLNDADIFVYPTTSNETFCIAALEALAMGCLTFTTNWGAFKELGEDYIETIEFESDLNKLSINYAKKLNILMDRYKAGEYDEKLISQSDYYVKKYSWSERAKEWNKFFEKLTNI
mgnify:CR=1 FL=1|tara:strand:+ start:376 stop:1302 length:927 start_codon:yes stop_codon:yes gene_type:complete